VFCIQLHNIIKKKTEPLQYISICFQKEKLIMITTMILVYLLSALAYTEHQTTKTLTCRYRRVQPNQSDRYDETTRLGVWMLLLSRIFIFDFRIVSTVW
jgi:hypothetical protein